MKNYEHLKNVNPYVYDEIFNWNVYQVTPEEINNANILDVGGHYGFFSCLCGSFNAKQIIAVEANPHNYYNFIKNTKDIPNVKAINAAVYKEDEKIITINNASEQSMLNKGDINVATITLQRLVELFGNEDVFLKMDIEGAEYDTLYNTPAEVLRRFNTIAIEMHEFADSTHKFTDLDSFIIQKGFNRVWRGVFYTNYTDGTTVENSLIAVYKYVRI
jgi:FkbM family methyltransferase